MAAHGTEAAAKAAATIRNLIGTERPVAGLVLGSGLAGLADRFDDVRRVEYRRHPRVPRSHGGRATRAC